MRMVSSRQRWRWSITTAAIVFLLISFIRYKAGNQLLLLDRLFPQGGWLQITVITLFAGWLFYGMYDRNQRGRLRRFSWLLFAILFFLQLLLGILVDSVFLLSGQLHFPVPSVILTGAIYRGAMSMMPLLFLSTILLTGGAWCSQLCYFGAFDSVMAGDKPLRISNRTHTRRARIRLAILLLFIIVALALRLFQAPVIYATLLAAISGIIGLIMVGISRREQQMIHCSLFCPIGVLVSYLKQFSIFRFHINSHCSGCMRCSTVCRYRAITPANIRQKKMSPNCTACGDCLSVCPHEALEYRFFRCSPVFSERLYLSVVVITYAVFLTVARI